MTTLPPPVRLQQIRIRVPRREWASVKTGRKREFRVPGTRATTMFPAPTPTPAIVYADADNQALVVLEDTWAERLGEITAASVEAEGAEDLADFRRRWCDRYNCRFRPLDPVRVYRIRPLMPTDFDAMGRVLLERLYGELL